MRKDLYGKIYDLVVMATLLHNSGLQSSNILSTFFSKSRARKAYRVDDALRPKRLPANFVGKGGARRKSHSPPRTTRTHKRLATKSTH